MYNKRGYMINDSENKAENGLTQAKIQTQIY